MSQAPACRVSRVESVDSYQRYHSLVEYSMLLGMIASAKETIGFSPLFVTAEFSRQAWFLDKQTTVGQNTGHG